MIRIKNIGFTMYYKFYTKKEKISLFTALLIQNLNINAFKYRYICNAI